MSNKLYFTVKELNPNGHPLEQAWEDNLKTLIMRLSAIREAYGRPMIVTSGFRSREDQERIYGGRDKIPYGSCHLIGAAADISDRDRSLAGFCSANVKLLEQLGLWCEDTTYTHTWVHFQIKPPVSGNRFFKP